ncbi:MAG: glycosyltransferase, partial [Candidatus Dormibacteraeota bacterium]|nr:glycosyltransferase [Candidatus Dormibacteraeota bacterium]
MIAVDRSGPALRTLHVIASMDARHGGDVRATIDLCTTLMLLGEHCEIATLDAPLSAGRGPHTARGSHDAAAQSGSAPGVTVHRFAPSPPVRLGNSIELARWLAHHARDYDLVEIHGVFRATTLIAATCARRAGVPYIVHPHGSLDPFDLRKHHTAKRLLAPLFNRLLLRPASAVVFTSPTEMRNADTFGALTHRACMPPPIVDDEIAGDRSRFRDRVGAADSAFVLLFMSRIDYKKGLIRTLRAVTQLRGSGLDLELAVAGTGDAAYTAKVLDAVRVLHIAEHVHFLGFVEGQAKADAFAGSDAFILASDNENFGVVVVEALRRRIPVIISDRVAIAADLEAAGAAVVVAADEASTAAGIAAVAGDPER